MKSKSQISWTENEVEILRTHGSVLLMPELSKLLPTHSIIAIRCKRKRLRVELSNDYKSRNASQNRSLLNEDKLCKLDYSLSLFDLDNKDKQVIIGSILGDGCVKRNGGLNVRNFIFYEGHSLVQADYVKWKSKSLALFQPRLSRMDSKPEMGTLSHPIFTSIRNDFYGALAKKNSIPNWAMSHIDLFGMMIWYLDDGYLGVPKSGFNCKGRRINPSPWIAAKGWDYDDLCDLCQTLNKKHGLNLYVRTSKHRDGVNKVVVIPAKDRDWILPTWQGYAIQNELPNCMYYKLDLHRGK